MAKKTVDPEDSKLFRNSIGKVNPVKSNKLIAEPNKKPRPFPKSSTPPLGDKLSASEELPQAALSLEDRLSYLSPGVQKNVLKKLRRGYFGSDAQLDLHGLSSFEAKHQLLRFLHFCVEDGCRCVHIIHGKGYRSPDHIPILKNHVDLWLRQHQDVQAFCSARPRDGGAGAVLVLLRLTEKYHEQEDSEY